jgi:hypothetical protein
VTGKVVALGRECDVPTPANTFAYAALTPYVNPGNAGWQLRLSGESRPSRHHRSTPSGRGDAFKAFRQGQNLTFPKITPRLMVEYRKCNSHRSAADRTLPLGPPDSTIWEVRHGRNPPARPDANSRRLSS